MNHERIRVIALTILDRRHAALSVAGAPTGTAQMPGSRRPETSPHPR